MNFANLLASSTKTIMLLPQYYDQLANRMEDYLIGIDEDLWPPIKSGPYRESVVKVVGGAAENESVTIDQIKKEANEKGVSKN